MQLSYFESVWDTMPDVKEYTFEEFVQAHEPVRTNSKEKVPLYSPAIYEGTRAKDNVREVTAIVFDIDDLTPEDYSTLVAVADSWSCQYLIHSTFSHHPNKPKLRVFIPLSRPIILTKAEDWSRNKWFAARERFQLAELGADASTKDPSRIYYIPCFHPDRNLDELGNDVPSVVYHYDLDAPTFDPSHLGDWDFSAPVTLNQILSTPLATQVADLASKLSRRKVTSAKEVGKRITKMLRGEVFADKGANDPLGGRDYATFLMAAHLAEEFPTRPAEELAQLFVPSLEIMKVQCPEDPPPTVDQVREKIERKQEEHRAAALAKEKEAADVRAALISRAFGTSRTEPYTEEEMARFGNMDHKWIIQCGNSYHLFFDGTYLDAVKTMDEMMLNVERDLSPALDVTLWTVDQAGNPVEKRPRELIRQYGDVAKEIVYDLVAQQASFSNKVLRIAKPQADITQAVKHPKIHKWLKLLGGEPLLNWLAMFYQLDKPLAALYLADQKGAGKSLLAKGLVRRWGPDAQYLEAEAAFSRFPVDLLECPFIFADEYVPDNLRTSQFRQMIQASRRTIDMKHVVPVKQEGHLRMMFAANNEYLIQTSEVLTTDDIEAINDRFIFIPTDKRPAEYLQKMVDEGEDLDMWWEDGYIAEHVLWLQETRNPQKTGRYLYGDVPVKNRLGARLALSSIACSDILEWCLLALEDYDAMQIHGKGTFKVTMQGVEILPKIIQRTWDTVMPGRRKVPSALKIANALEPISEDTEDGRKVITRYFLQEFNKKAGIYSAGALGRLLDERTREEDTEIEGFDSAGEEIL